MENTGYATDQELSVTLLLCRLENGKLYDSYDM